MPAKNLRRVAIYTRARLGAEARKLLFEEIWQVYYRRILIFVRQLVPSSDTDDVVQEVMLRVYRNLEKYRPEHAVSTWIYTIARNLCIDHLRRTDALTDTSGITADIESSYQGVEESFLSEQQLLLARQLIDGLAQADRSIAYLRFYEEMSYSDISKVMTLPAGTVKYRVHSIRKQLRKRREGLLYEKA